MRLCAGFCLRHSGDICVPACPKCCGQKWTQHVSLDGTLPVAQMTTFTMVSPFTEKCIRRPFAPRLMFVHSHPHAAHGCLHIFARRGLMVSLAITGTLACLRDKPSSHIQSGSLCAHLCVHSVHVCICVLSCITLPLIDHKHNGPT